MVFEIEFDEICTVGDQVDHDTWELVRFLGESGKRVVIVSHLSESFRTYAADWLSKHFVEYHELQMEVE